MKQSLTGILFLVTLITVSGCSNVGTNFDTNLATQIQKGKTTQSEIAAKFGQPYKTGVQNNHPAWVYEYDQYRAIGADSSKDLLVVFNDDKTVRLYQFMSTGSIDEGSGSSSGHAKGSHDGSGSSSGHGKGSHDGSGSSSGHGKGSSDGSGDSSGHAKGTGLNNYNCGSCSTTYKK